MSDNEIRKAQEQTAKDLNALRARVELLELAVSQQSAGSSPAPPPSSTRPPAEPKKHS